MKGAWFCGINSNTYSLYYKALWAGSFLVRFLSLVPFRVEIWFSVIGKANVYRFVYSKSVFYNMQHFTETEIICKKLPFFHFMGAKNIANFNKSKLYRNTVLNKH